MFHRKGAKNGTVNPIPKKPKPLKPPQSASDSSRDATQSTEWVPLVSEGAKFAEGSFVSHKLVVLPPKMPKSPTSKPSPKSVPLDKTLEAAISQINKDFGEGSVIRMSSDFRAKVDVIPTGNLLIDHALGVGGFPRGRIVEVYGPESAGKSTLCLSVVAEAQKMGLRCAFIDVEHAVDLDYARKLGVNVPSLLFSQPDGGEEALTICEKLVSTKSLGVIVIDSVAALVTRAEREGEIGDATVGAQARLMSAALRKLGPLIGNANTCVIFTNQIREKVGVMFGNPETTSGGRALKFYASIRIDIRRSTQLKTPEGEVYGNRTKITVVKNKVAPPHTKAEFDLLYGEGISGLGSLVDVAIQFEVLCKRGSWISYKGAMLAQGRDGAKEALRKDSSLRDEVEREVKEKMSSPKESQLTEQPEEDEL